MTWLFENPWPALVAGVIAEGVLAIVLVTSGRGKWIGVMVLVALLTIGLLVMERLVVTEVERVENSLDEVAVALEHNDRQGVLDHLSPSAAGLRSHAASTLQQLTINEAHIGSDLTVRINELKSPPTATATFTARISGDALHGGLPYKNMVQRLRVILHKEQNRWLIFSYDEVGLKER